MIYQKHVLITAGSGAPAHPVLPMTFQIAPIHSVYHTDLEEIQAVSITYANTDGIIEFSN